MKRKLVIVDFEFSVTARRRLIRFGIPLAVVLVGSAIAYAGGNWTLPHEWSNPNAPNYAGPSLKASDLDDNFAALADAGAALDLRVTTLEGGPIAFGNGSSINSYGGFQFGRTFSVTPVVVGSILQLDPANSGMELYLKGSSRSDVSLQAYCFGNAQSDRVPWVAAEPGSYTVGGHLIQMGVSPSQGSSSFSVTFPQSFPTPPIVIVTPTSNSCRVTTTSVSGFSVECLFNNAPSAAASVNWLAIEATGATPIAMNNGHSLQAGVAGTGNSSGTITFPVQFSARPFVTLVTLYTATSSGATSVRINGLPTATGFSYLSQTCSVGPVASQQVNWVAID